MTDPVGLAVSVALALVCAAVPLVVAHRARDAADRLPGRPLALLVLATFALFLVALSWADAHLFGGFTLDHVSAIVGAVVGLLVGLFGLAAYGVLERLVRPLVWRVER